MDIPSLLGVIGLVIVLVVIIRRFLRGSKTHNAWIQLADQTSLVYHARAGLFGEPLIGSINGTYRDRKLSFAYTREFPKEPIEVWEEERKPIRAWIEIKVTEYGSLSLSYRSFPSGIVDKNHQLETKIGDEEFDKQFKIYCEPADLARQVFSSLKLRQRLLKVPTPSFEVSKAKSGLESRMTMRERDADYWQSVMDILCDVAEEVDNISTTRYSSNLTSDDAV